MGYITLSSARRIARTINTTERYSQSHVGAGSWQCGTHGAIRIGPTNTYAAWTVGQARLALAWYRAGLYIGG